MPRPRPSGSARVRGGRASHPLTSRTALAGIGLAALTAIPAPAGPWARDPGAVFVTLGVSAEDTQTALLTGTADPDLTGSLYAEIGLGHRLTFGLDAAGTEAAGIGTAFLRLTLTAPDSPFQAAVDLGRARLWDDDNGPADLARLGASIGWGFDAWSMGQGSFAPGHQGGWMTLQATLLHDLATDEQIWQAEATLGLNLGQDWRATLAVKAEDWRDDGTAVTLRPSVIYAFSEDTALQLGGHIGIDGSDAAGLSLSLWQSF